MTLPTASPLVVCLGAHILDILGRPVTAIPPGQGSVLLEEIRLTAAGTAAGTAVDLARLGARVVSMGAIGDDDLARLLVSLLDRHGVDTSHLARVPGVQTSATMLPIRPNGERPALHVPGATPHLRPGDVDTGLIAAADVLHVGGPDVLGRFAGEPLATVLAAARAAGTLVTMDLLRPGSPEVLDRLAPLLRYVDYFLPNSGQLLAITGAADLDGAIKTILDAGAGAVAVTMGEDGSRIVAGGTDARIPALPVPVVDTTGCGDAYSAGFITGICHGWGPEAAGWLGTAVAALVAQGLGSDATLTGLDQALDLIPAETTRLFSNTEGRPMTATDAHARTTDAALRARAAAVIPGGMYGHQSAAGLPGAFPQFMARGAGARVWDVDGREYVDLMCSYGPVILGHHHPKVEAAAEAQRREADCQNAPSPRMVELAEALTATVAHADWAMFAKNGTDATTLALMIARAATGRRKILAARGSYHGAAPWCTPRPGGVTAEDRAHMGYFRYNDLASAQQAADAVAGDLAGVIVTPFRHDIGQDQELADPEFARGLRALCDRTGAALILDDVRCGFRLHLGSSWEPLGVAPDLSAWSKAIANGYALAAVLGGEAFRAGATEVFTTGSFWFSAVSMAAGLATLEALAEQDAVATMTARGQALRDGLAEQAARQELAIRQTGPPQMPFLTFAGDRDFALANTFAGEAARRGAFLHPRHNWFVSAATTPADLDLVLDATDHAFAAVRRHIDAGPGHAS